jgi:hypothetical protein
VDVHAVVFLLRIYCIRGGISREFRIWFASDNLSSNIIQLN